MSSLIAFVTQLWFSQGAYISVEEREKTSEQTCNIMASMDKCYEKIKMGI